MTLAECIEMLDDLKGYNPSLRKMDKDALAYAIKILERVDEMEDVYSELRGLLKEHAQFPDMWDTDQRLKEWLIERKQY